MFVTLNYGYNLIDAEIWINANPIVTPTPIQIELYFLVADAIWRCIPNKLVGVSALGLLVTVLYLLMYCSSSLLYSAVIFIYVSASPHSFPIGN